MRTLLKAKLACVTAVGFIGCLSGLAGAASLNLKKPQVEAASQLHSPLTPYLQLHYEAESMLMLGLRPASTRAIQANLVGLPCLPENKGAKHG